jgi:hypothetical protein
MPEFKPGYHSFHASKASSCQLPDCAAEREIGADDMVGNRQLRKRSMNSAAARKQVQNLLQRRSNMGLCLDKYAALE